MKLFLTSLFCLLMSLNTYANDFPYTQKWKEITEMEQKGLLKSTLPKILDIYKQAKSDQNRQETIKALVYQSKVIIETDEESQLKIINNFKTEITETKGVEKGLIQSMLAEIYFQYYQNNRHKFNQRTETETKSDDFRKWDLKTLFKEIEIYYDSSLQNETLLQKEPIGNWDYLLTKGTTNARDFRPTLYDFLTNRALGLYQTGKNYYFDENNTDNKCEIKIANLYQKLILFHQNDVAKDALIQVKLDQINYLVSKSNFEKHILDYQGLAKLYPENKQSAKVLFTLAQGYINNSHYQQNEGDNNDSKSKNAKIAFTICTETIQKYPNTDGAKDCEELKKSILLKHLNNNVEKILFPNRENLMQVTHKNINQVFVRILSITPEIDAFLTQPLYMHEGVKNIEKIAAMQPIATWTETLKTFDDYNTHTTLIKIKPLNVGEYLILVSDNKDFISVTQALNYSRTTVSNYSVSSRNLGQKGMEIQINERFSGLPLTNSKVDIYVGKTFSKTFTTDTDGRFIYQRNNTTNEYQNPAVVLKVVKEGVLLPLNQYYGYYGENQEPQWNNTTSIFTDRAIYRPGQVVYFKAILMQNKERESRVLANTVIHFDLMNPNGEPVSSLDLTSNEYGSVQGNFVLPTSGLTGHFSLNSNYGLQDIRVEEYKRPKFEVTFKPLTAQYKLDQMVSVTGNATAFSGANIDHAKVVYRVYREAIQPYWYWWCWRRPNIKASPAEEITNGITQTKADGSFTIDFIAKSANEKLDKEDRNYSYKIIADITDLNGETHTNEIEIKIGDKALILQSKLADKVIIDELKTIPIESINLNNSPITTKGSITLTKLIAPKNVLRPKVFDEIEYQLYNKEDWQKSFPYENYLNEDKLENREKDKPVFTTAFDTGIQKEVPITASNLVSGYYILYMTAKDANGQNVEASKLVYLYKNDETKSVDNAFFTVTSAKEIYHPAETGQVNFSTATDNSVVLVELEFDGKIIKKETIKLTNQTKAFTFPIEEKYRGGALVNYIFVKYGVQQVGTININIPFDNKDLQFSVETLRNKLLPNTPETWSFNIKGPKKDKVIAELLAGMYDASLDQFTPQSWNFHPYSFQTYSQLNGWDGSQTFGTEGFSQIYAPTFYPTYSFVNYDNLNWFGFYFHNYNDHHRMYGMMKRGGMEPMASMTKSKNIPEGEMMMDAVAAAPAMMMENEEGATRNKIVSGSDMPKGSSDAKPQKPLNVQARKALQETAFFFPQLKTDAEGNVKVSFTIPESLTSWKFMALAHTPSLQSVQYQTTVQTQKELMVVPNVPRFLREDDEVVFASKINNLSDKVLTGDAQLQLFDAFSMKPLDVEFNNNNNTQKFNTEKGNSTNLSWTLKIPKNIQAILYRIVAKAGDFSDGEENTLPILTNRMMVTETMPIHIREGQQKTFTLDKLAKNESKTLDNYKLTLEMTTNPLWYAVMSLPYLREFPYECSEQLFSRFYGNVLSGHLLNQSPKIKAVFDSWNKNNQLISPLEKNQELKNLLLEETPWVREAQDEKEQMKRIAVLFEVNQMAAEMQTAYAKLKARQMSSGGFSWFDGGKESDYITTHIVTGFGHLKKLGLDFNTLKINPTEITNNAVNYLDQEFIRRDKERKKLKWICGYDELYYLYARSFYITEQKPTAQIQSIINVCLKNIEINKLDYSIENKALAALVLNRFGKKALAVELVKSLKDHAVETDELGMYWKANVGGWYWHQAPVETQALVIEAFDEITKDTESVESMKVWLIKNRQTNRWNSTKATTEAVYALLNTGKSWLNSEEGVTVKIGENTIDPTKLENSPQAGSGYYKTSWSNTQIKPNLATVDIKKTTPGVAWGTLYWQYFENLDKITLADAKIIMRKKLFIQKNTETGPLLTEIKEGNPIKIGDLVKVRLEIETDRVMQFVHIKDMRAAGFEPVNVLSQYKWQDGFGYYESTRDTATNFFIDYLPKGVFVFEYEVRANNAGNFSNGITSLQNMYAPEFGSHSEGIRVEIK